MLEAVTIRAKNCVRLIRKLVLRIKARPHTAGASLKPMFVRLGLSAFADEKAKYKTRKKLFMRGVGYVSCNYGSRCLFTVMNLRMYVNVRGTQKVSTGFGLK